MKKRWLWFVPLAALAVLLPTVLARLPHPQEELLHPTPPPFAGVIDLWVVEGFRGSKAEVNGWLNGRFAEYERAHTGTLVHIRTMSAASAERYLAQGVAPDGIVFPLGADIELSAKLSPLAYDAPVRQALRDAGTSGGQPLAAPLAMGGYALMGNGKRMDEARAARDLPWRDKLAALYGEGSRKASAWYALQCPRAGIGDPAAALVDMAGGSAFYGECAAAAVPDDLAIAAPDRAWSDFVMDGRYGMYVATQREIGRIQELVAGGRDFDWTIEAASGYTDLVWFFGIPRRDDEDPAKRRSMEALLAHMLAPSSQERLQLAGFLSVLEGGAALYPDAPGMAELESALGAPDIAVPNAFVRRPDAVAEGAAQRLRDAEAWLSRWR